MSVNIYNPRSPGRKNLKLYISTKLAQLGKRKVCNPKIAGLRPLCVTTFLLTLFAYWHTSTSLQVKTHNQNDWSMTNQIENNALKMLLVYLKVVYIVKVQLLIEKGNILDMHQLTSRTCGSKTWPSSVCRHVSASLSWWGTPPADHWKYDIHCQSCGKYDYHTSTDFSSYKSFKIAKTSQIPRKWQSPWKGVC